MKKTLFFLALFISCIASAQVATDTGALRTQINTRIISNGNKQITGQALNDVLNGMRNLPVPVPASYVATGVLDPARIPTYSLSVITPLHVYTPTTSLYIDTATALVNGILLKGDWSIFNAKAPTASPTFTGIVNINGSGAYNFNEFSTSGGSNTATGAYIKESADAHGRFLIGTYNGGGFYEPCIWIGTNADAPTLSNYSFNFDGGGAGTVVNAPSTDDISFRINNSTKGKIDHSSGKLSIGTDARIGTIASSATPTPDADGNDQYNVTALAAAATFGAPTGTPLDGQSLIIRIKDNATPRTLSWNAIYRAGSVSLPTTTQTSKTIYTQFLYNGADSKWDLIIATTGL